MYDKIQKEKWGGGREGVHKIKLTVEYMFPNNVK